MTEQEKILQLDAIDQDTQRRLQRLFQDQFNILRCAYHLLYAEPNYFIADDGGSFRFRSYRRRGDGVRVTKRRQSSAVREPALVAGSVTCIRSRCEDPPRGAFPQAWAPLRGRYGLGLGRGFVFDRYAQCFKGFLREVYSLEGRRLPSGFFNFYYNVDHVVPAIWLLRPSVRRGRAPDPASRDDIPSETADAISRREIVEYVSLMLVPATVNQAWGGYERRMGRIRRRFGSLGGASLPSLAKALGIMPPPRAIEEVAWTARLIVTLMAHDLFGEGEGTQLLSGAEFRHLGTEAELLASRQLDVSPLVTRWLASSNSPPIGVNARNAAAGTPACGARCFSSNGRHLIQLDHPGLPPVPLAEGDDLQEAMRLALVAANSILKGMRLPQVDRLDVTRDNQLLDG